MTRGTRFYGIHILEGRICSLVTPQIHTRPYFGSFLPSNDFDEGNMEYPFTVAMQPTLHVRYLSSLSYSFVLHPLSCSSSRSPSSSSLFPPHIRFTRPTIMKFALVSSVLACVAFVSAHSREWALHVAGTDQGDGQGKYLRQPPNNNPVKDLTS